MDARDWLLHGGTVLDGRGLSLPADVRLSGGRVVSVRPRDGDAVAAAAGVPAERRLDCTGLYVAPGFIDAHTHDDTAAADPTRYEAKLRQGITTAIVGQDGFGWAPLPRGHRAAVVRYWRPVNGLPRLPDGARLASTGLGGYFRALQGRAGLNVAVLAGHANLRVAVAGWRLRGLGRAERVQMARALEACLRDGACGLSTGLTYIPARASDSRELLDLAYRLTRVDRPYVSHLRGYGATIFAAVDEALDLARQTGCRVHLSHLHLSSRAVWGQAGRLLEQVERAIGDGLRVTWDLYPYQAGSSVLYQYLSPDLQDGGPAAFLRRLRAPEAAGLLAADPSFAAADWSTYVISHTASGLHVGENVAEAARGMGLPVADAVVRLLVDEDLDVGCVVHQTREEDDRALLLHPACAVGSDGVFASGRPHPRAYGAFARFWRLYVRAGALSPEEAVRRMAGLAAGVHGLRDRGELRSGMAADVTVFDGARFADRATYEDPRQPADGVRHVFVNGEAELLDGVFQPGVRAGRPLAVVS